MYKDYKTAKDRLNMAKENDWYIIPLVIVIALLIAAPFIIRVHNVDKMMEQEVVSE